jgi:D-erythronate 2-dehydrogenase
MTRMLTLPGITVSIGEMVDALEEVAGARVAARVRWEPDPMIQKIVAGWPTAFDARRARAMGFEADRDFAEIIRAHVEDELGGVVQ